MPGSVHPDRAVGESSDRFEIVGYEHNRDATILHLLYPPDAPLLKKDIAHRERFIHDQNAGIHVNCHGKGQAHKHAARVSFHLAVDKLTDLRSPKILQNKQAVSYSFL